MTTAIIHADFEAFYVLPITVWRTDVW